MSITDLAHAVGAQVKADLRPHLVGTGLLGFIFVPAVFVLAARQLGDEAVGPATGGTYMIASIIAVIGALVAMSVMSEMYAERMAGTLLRVRILPNGPLIWSVGKTLTTTIVMLGTQILIFIAARIFLFDFDIPLSRLLLGLAIAVLVILACAPLGFVLGSLIRGTYTNLLGTLVFVAVMITSGSFFPMELLPRWVQLIHQVLPFYWAGHLARATLLGGEPAFEPSGEYMPVVAIAVLLAWLVIGFGLAVVVIRRSFRNETISSLSGIQAKIRSQVGIS